MELNLADETMVGPFRYGISDSSAEPFRGDGPPVRLDVFTPRSEWLAAGALLEFRAVVDLARADVEMASDLSLTFCTVTHMILATGVYRRLPVF
jgi:hypothetical protein